ncbi:MAG: hypothetical protein NTY38_19675 [Acidobacteria bacterium]|nr:hypothetical protein [Acidobacteriota bacterium]
MNCERWERDIALDAGGDLEDSVALEQHLLECRECAEFARGLRVLRAEWRQMPEPSPVDVARLEARVRSAVEREPRRWWWWLAAAAVLVVAVLLRPRPVPEPVVPIARVLPSTSLPDNRGTARSSKRKPSRGRQAALRPRQPEDQVVLRLDTDDPDVVFYLFSDSKGVSQ